MARGSVLFERHSEDDGEDRSGQGHEEVSIPLLQQDPSSSSAPSSSRRPPPRDSRFAISEDDVEAPSDEDEDDDQVAGSGSGGYGPRGDAATSQHTKYPPTSPSSLPPSYREAIYVKDPWYRSEVALSLQHYGRICFGSLSALLRQYWPTSRFAQAGFFIVGLWIIVIVSGPTWDKSARGWSKNVDEFLALIPPSPISGDGHYVQLADWSSANCQKYGIAAYCSRKMSYNLEIPHEPRSLFTSDKIFVYIDPPRSAHLSDGRGSVPATVQVKMDGELEGQAKVDIEAFYEYELEPLLARAHVGLMKAGLRDQGVGIYTWPLPPNLVNVPKALYPYPLLSFKVTVHVPPSVLIPNLRIEGSDIDIAVFADLPKPDTANGRHLSRRSLPGKVESTSSNSRRRHIGRSVASDRPSPRGRLGYALARRQASAKDDPANPHPLFGSLIAVTRHGSLSLGGSIRATGRLWAENSDGPVEVKQDTHLRAHEIHLEAGRGELTIEKDALLESRNEVLVLAHNGNISVSEGVKILGTRLDAEADNGKLVSPQGTWYSNHTMILKGAKGVEAAVGVNTPWRSQLGTGTEQRPYVSVDASSQQGDMNLRFVEHVEKTPLRVNAKAPEGQLTVALNKEYAGSYHLLGGAGSKVTSAPAAEEKDKARTRVFSFADESKSANEYDAKGEVWWRNSSSAAGDSSPLKGTDMWGSVEAVAKGAGKLSFEG